MIRWKYSLAEARAVAVECAERGYPHKDADGETQFENTHFDHESKAWEKLLRETEAGLSLATGARQRAQLELQRLTDAVADEAVTWKRARENWAARKRETGAGR